MMMLLAQVRLESILPAVFGCCGLPLLLILIIYSVLKGLRNQWRNRGIEPDGLYCAACRFDLRGGVSLTCPECGALLHRQAMSASPVGSMLSTELSPPISRTDRILLYLLVGAAPIVLGLWIIGTMMPINYATVVDFQLTGPDDIGQTSSFATETRFEINSNSGWTTPQSLHQIRANPSGHTYTPKDSDDQDAQLRAFASKTWRALIQREPWHAQGPSAQAARDEWGALIYAACTFDRQATKNQASYFQPIWSERPVSHFHPVYLFAACAVGLACLTLLLYRAIKDAAKDHRAFTKKVHAIHDRYAHLVHENRQRPRIDTAEKDT